jgi:hypothetical protein
VFAAVLTPRRGIGAVTVAGDSSIFNGVLTVGMYERRQRQRRDRQARTFFLSSYRRQLRHRRDGHDDRLGYREPM